MIDNAYTSLTVLKLLAPELILYGAAVAIFVAGAFSRSKSAWSWFAGLALVASALALVLQTPPQGFVGPLAADSMAWFLRWLVLALGGGFVMLMARPATLGQAPEVVGSLLIAVAGSMLVVGAGELTLLFLGLESISIPTYVLLYVSRREAAAQESTVKYFYLSILASAVTLYGFSFLYGVTGSTHLADISRMLPLQAGVESPGWGALPQLALVLIFAGLAFKMAAAPMHFYAPDVYQGSSHQAAALLAVLPKIAGAAALLRVAIIAMPATAGAGWRVALVLAVITMTIGNVLALWQQNVRRLLAYSSIAHSGYMLIGVAAALSAMLGPADGRPQEGIGAVLLYSAAYGFSTLGAFAILAWLGSDGRQIHGVDELAGLARARPWAAAGLAIMMFSLAGLPPLAGFWGKLALFLSALSVQPVPGGEGRSLWFVVLAIVGVLNAAIAAAYYLRIISVMYFRPLVGTPASEGGAGASWASACCVIVVLAMGLILGPLLTNTATQAGLQATRLPRLAPPPGAPTAVAADGQSHPLAHPVTSLQDPAGILAGQ